VGTCRSKSPCSYTVDYRVLGDPYPFYPKDFIVKYNCSDGTKHQNVVPPEAGYGSVTTLVCDKTTLAK